MTCCHWHSGCLPVAAQQLKWRKVCFSRILLGVFGAVLDLSLHSLLINLSLHSVKPKRLRKRVLPASSLQLKFTTHCASTASAAPHPLALANAHRRPSFRRSPSASSSAALRGVGGGGAASKPLAKPLRLQLQQRRRPVIALEISTAREEIEDAAVGGREGGESLRTPALRSALVLVSP